MLVKEAFNLPIWVDGDIGIEIEVEGEDLPNNRNLFNTIWFQHEDGSLRGEESAEYVLQRPVMVSEVRDVIEVLNKKFASKKSVNYNSYRAGTHIHVNVQHLTVKQLVNYLTLSLIFENVLVEWCGPTRVGNHFCLRTCDAEYGLNYIKGAIKDGYIEGFHDDSIRYSAINVSSIPKHGSLEFRSLDSTISVDRIVTWVEVLVKIREEAKSYNNPLEIIKGISHDGYENFMRKVFGEHYNAFVVDDLGRKLRQGVVHAQEIAYCRKWNMETLNIFLKSSRLFS